MQDSNTIEEHKNVIAALCAAAPDDEVRNCLRKYDPTKTDSQIENNLKKFSKSQLVQVLAYLGVPDMNQYRADALPHEVVCRIQNLLPDTCHLCKQVYAIKLDEKPILSCAICGQGSHNTCILQLLNIPESELNERNNFGKDLVNPYSSIGLFYVCGERQKTEFLKRSHSRRSLVVENKTPSTTPPTRLISQFPTRPFSVPRITPLDHRMYP